MESPTLESALSGADLLIAGRYRVRARLGRGAAKEVFLVYDERLDREVALALVTAAGKSATARARVEREARITGRLGDHPNVITVYDTGEVDGVPYLVLRAMPGGSLADRLDHGRLPIPEAIRIGRQIATALAHAHAHGVVHRDVKPDNVWLAADGTAALGDFGIAHREGADRLTDAGVVLGTVRYLSPEQIGGGEVGPPSDLYALGVTLYELVAGRPPFTAEDPAHVLTQHLSAVPESPSRHEPAVPGELEVLILELLAKAPAARPASASDVADALADLSHAPPERPRRADSRRPASVLAARADASDPEALRGVLDRGAEIVERHGGAVERYLGDGLIALFASSEDDPLRAAHAAVELSAAGLRAGIDSGEVFLGAGPRGETIATGAALSAAEALAARAAAGEVLVGERIRHALDAEVEGDRLVALRAERPGVLRASRTPFVGRERELGELRAAFARVRDDAACRLVTIAGPPGVGKSRLARELVDALGDEARVLVGRCLGHGEGTTYRALEDVVRDLDVDALLGEQAARSILGAIGRSEEPVQPEETAWAFRRLLERLARERPLVVAIEDIHWAADGLLDLLDHVAALSTGSPIMLVCLTRPELLDERPAWAAPQPNRSVLLLDALGDGEARELAARLGAAESAERIARRAEGNPLFVEQLVAVRDADELPVTIQAVLAARLDRLEVQDRTLLQRAAVEGRTFHATPLDDVPGLRTRLVALAHKGLIAADAPRFDGEDAFRFTHSLIRDAAYAGLPKRRRAELHAGLAAWLDDRAEDEIVGHHLEQACLLAAELGQGESALARRAVARLHSASTAALGRGDPAAASDLLARAAALDGGAELLPELGAALFEAGRIADASRVLDDAIARAPEPRLRSMARVEREFVRLETETGAGTEHARRVVDEAAPILAGDEHGQVRLLSLRAQVAWIGGRVGEADTAWCEAAKHADERELAWIIGWRATAAVLGPTPVDEAIRRCEAFLDVVAPSPVAVAQVVNPLASLHAMRGQLETAERLVRQANETLRELGSLDASVSHHEALVRLLAGQPVRAEAPLRAGLERLESITDSGMLATTSAMLAQALYAQGRLGEANEQCDVASRLGAADDIVTQVIWRGVRAKVLARAGSCDDAEALAREAVAMSGPTDLLTHRADAMLDLADVLRVSSRSDEADASVRTGLSLYERKGNVVGAARARALLSNRWEGA
jgi:tetratricopeptide (TPR) repeat protein